MNTAEKICEKLKERHPTKEFSSKMIVDQTSLKPWTMITCNGKETPYGFFPELIVETAAIHGDESVDHFIEAWLAHNAIRFTHF